MFVLQAVLVLPHHVGNRTSVTVPRDRAFSIYPFYPAYLSQCLLRLHINPLNRVEKYILNCDSEKQLDTIIRYLLLFAIHRREREKTTDTRRLYHSYDKLKLATRSCTEQAGIPQEEDWV